VNWFERYARSDISRIRNNLLRLQNLKTHIHRLGYVAIASHSTGFKALEQLIDNQLVRGRPFVLAKLKEALIGENNQKLALDNPMMFQRIMNEAEVLTQQEINKELKELGKLQGSKK
jgi:hypothetical protein